MLHPYSKAEHANSRYRIDGHPLADTGTAFFGGLIFWNHRAALSFASLFALTIFSSCTPSEGKADTHKNSVSYFSEEEFSRNDGGQLTTSPYFTKHSLDRGISIDIPNDWYVLDKRTVGAIVEQGAIALDVADMQNGLQQPENLIKANSSPTNPGAILSVNVDVPPSLLPSELFAMTGADLTAAEEELRGLLEKGLRAGGITMTKFYGAHLDQFGPYPAVVIEYERASLLLDHPGDFIVQINQIAMGDKTVKLTMSYRISDAFIWKPRMSRIRKSLILN